MTQPQTNYETSGAWTTLEHEADFLAQIEADTDLVVEIAGHSVEGKPIRRVMLGTGVENTVLIVCLQHGNEPASREAALAQIRDLAYSTDPAVVSYLENHRIVWIPTAGPDSFPGRRNNSNGVNPNRDFFKLSQPEPQAIVSTINSVRPHLIVDAHEYFYTGEDWWGAQGQMAGVHPAITSLEEEIFNHGRTVLAGHGFSSKHYPIGTLPRAGLSGYASCRHAVGLLSETNASQGTIDDRVAVQRIILDMVIDWHEDHASELKAAHDDSVAWALNSTGVDSLKIRQEYLGRDTVEEVRLFGYQLSEPLDPTLVEMHGMVVGEDLFAPMQQTARLVLPQIADPDAMDKQAESTRVERVDPDPEPETPRESLPNRPLIGMRINVSGQVRDVVGMRLFVNGRAREVIVPT